MRRDDQQNNSKGLTHPWYPLRMLRFSGGQRCPARRQSPIPELSRTARFPLLCLLLLASGSGCVRRDAPSGDEGTNKETDEEFHSHQSTVATIEIPPVTDALVSDVLQRWLQARNDADFPAYSAMYARRFTGVQRRGDTVRPLDRAAWLADSALTFPGPTPVVADELELLLGVASASVRFTQWQTGSSDRKGRVKQLVLELEDEKLRITREEELPDESPPVAPHTLPIHPIINVAEAAYVVLGPATTVVAPKLSVTAGVYTTLGKTIAPDFADWSGKQLRVLTSTGRWCPALGQEVVALAQSVPPASEVVSWREQGLSNGAIAKLLFDASLPVTAVRLATAPTLSCDGEWLLAQDSRQPKPAVARVHDDPYVLSAAKTALQSHPQFRHLQPKRNDAASGPTASVAQPPYHFVARAFAPVESGPQWAWVKALSNSACDGSGRGLSVLFEVGQEQPLTLTEQSHTQLGRTLARAESTSALLDLDGDGAFEVLFNEVATGDTLFVDDEGQTLQRIPANVKVGPCSER